MHAKARLTKVQRFELDAAKTNGYCDLAPRSSFAHTHMAPKYCVLVRGGMPKDIFYRNVVFDFNDYSDESSNDNGNLGVLLDLGNGTDFSELNPSRKGTKGYIAESEKLENA